MNVWCMNHPYMTFFIIIFTVFIIGLLIEDLLNCYNNKNVLKNGIEVNKNSKENSHE